MTTPSATEVLVPIWQRVLQRSSIRVDDNFFDLGGDAASAAKLFAEIAQAYGRDLPPVLIVSAPTIEALAALLEQPDPPRVPALLQLQPGTGSQPIFIAHGLGDTVLGLYQLAKRIASPHPIYGMQARGIDGVDEPCESIEERAQHHLDAIRQLQPHGPYFLIGYSLGGLVTLEMAQRLSASGEKIALLALLDSYPDRNHLSLLQRMLLLMRLTGRRAGRVVQGTDTSHQEELGTPTQRVMQRMRDSDYRALRRYQPRFYRGRIRFVKAGIPTYFPDDPVPVWTHLAEQFEVETVPGNHLAMLTTQVEELSTLLSRYLRESAAV